MPVSLQDIRFVAHEVLDYAGHYAALQPAPTETPDRAFIDAMLDEVHRFSESVLEPLNGTGDREGCRFEGGAVTTPDGFKAAYQTYAGGGWAGMTGDPAYGGQGLPHSLSLLLEDLIGCANMAWGMYPALSRGVINALTAHGSEAQKAEFLPRLLSGRWTGTMCLTEPHAGSDVGLARTRAERGADGTYRVTGTKIFISAGDHDLADNILHLVLARLPEAPAGTQGISMFVVPKLLPDGSRNGVECGGIEQKMGIHGNATCTLNFDGAVGHLVGEPNRGMRYMFTMMNAARLVVGLQGVCGAHAACLRSLAYATERLQMRSLTGPVAPDRPADPIIAHGDVRRMLLTQRAIAEGGRLLVYYAGQIADLAGHGEDGEQRRALELLDFLTPIVKGVLTELGYESVNHALQIYGGHGYVRDNGVEQYVRDMRITLIYEGTTQIQALDLLGRKVLQTQGKGLMHFLAEMGALEARLRPLRPDLAQALGALSQEWGELALGIGGKAGSDLNEVAAGAVDFLFYSGYAVLAYCWGRMAEAAVTRLADGHDDFLQGKLAVADFYFARMLPRRVAHKLAIEAGPATLLGPDSGIIAAL
jgi:alkylation response protein AidB-like acyl-CoA dehydrogenase